MLTTYPTAARTFSKSGKATITVTFADGTTTQVGGARAERAQAVILAAWRDESIGVYGARADLHAAQVEAHRLATATMTRASSRHHAMSRTPAREAHAIPVTDHQPTPAPQEDTMTTDTTTDLLIANGKAHRSTCKRLPAGTEPYTPGTPATPASCCKPKLVLAVPAPEPEPQPEPELAPEGAERVAAAKAEHRAHKDWIIAGKVGPEPATPNLDDLNRVYAEQGPKAARPKAPKADGSKGRGPRTDSALYAQAMAAKKAKARTGSGAKVDDATMVARATELAGQGLTSRQAMEIAYWLDGWAFSRTRWDNTVGQVWAATV